MSNANIILLNGLEGEEKDSIITIFESHGFKKYAFANYLKEYASKKYEIPLNYFYDKSLKDTPLLEFPLLSSPINKNFLQMYQVFKFTKTVLGDSPQSLSDIESITNEDGETTLSFKGDTLHHTPKTICILEDSLSKFINSNIWINDAFTQIDKERCQNIIITDNKTYSEYLAILQKYKRDYKITRIYITDNPSNYPSSYDYILNKDYEKKINDIINNLFLNCTIE